MGRLWTTFGWGNRALDRCRGCCKGFLSDRGGSAVHEAMAKSDESLLGDVLAILGQHLPQLGYQTLLLSIAHGSFQKAKDSQHLQQVRPAHLLWTFR